ncbi:thiamine phosphate synthase [Sporolactobacillus sp. THM19-2]|uniref:thiamine phosphate synthase n=1 Tax=Sporolactobacillus sp. THM19-2 TaxID=2511171 RepID=UPI00101F1305|nr:thiamine phosphate synthase [Sporolactobacillus sp. THM19-2]RYL93994.1 thiamine phosphate synthase [Sporolactobacillus sp. THM19-2]
MAVSNPDYTLYLVTGPFDPKAADLYFQKVEEALRGGVTLLQLREKTASSRTMFEVACKLNSLADRYHVPLIINDRVDIALAAGADGVHVGQEDLPADKVRQLVGSEKIVGVSASTVAEAIRAEKDGADYIGAGSLFPTRSKSDATRVSADVLHAIRQAVGLPIVGIGGIDRSTLNQIDPNDIDGVAVISAIWSQDDTLNAARALRDQWNHVGR